ncbi:hypothetical protein [Pseudoflavitalea rhizosphaerae]|uniref:hypothetical protein n=1 Tax=Pseudoflavitalea rhizosphaerae TaxID=1884793 RepID=UPI000F8C363E|nr:hypothetical protein [Pseudoflavitalea rhizosphaerae]
MSLIDENYHYLVNIVLPSLGIKQSDFPELRQKIEKGTPFFICTKKVALEVGEARFDFKFKRNASRPTDLRYYLDEIRAILIPNDGMTQLKVFQLFRQKGKHIEEIILELQKLHLLGKNQMNSFAEVTGRLLKKGNSINDQEIRKRKSI